MRYVVDMTRPRLTPEQEAYAKDNPGARGVPYRYTCEHGSHLRPFDGEAVNTSDGVMCLAHATEIGEPDGPRLRNT